MGLVERWTSWIGGPFGLISVLSIQVILVGLIFVEPSISAAIIFGAISVVVVLERPLLGVGITRFCTVVVDGRHGIFSGGIHWNRSLRAGIVAVSGGVGFSCHFKRKKLCGDPGLGAQPTYL